MIKVRKKEILLALQWTGENEEKAENFTKRQLIFDYSKRSMQIPILGKLVTLSKGDWVIKNEDTGEITVCKKAQFEMIFEKVDGNLNSGKDN